MDRQKYLILFIVGLIVSVTAALIQSVPGYMDAEYYYAGGLQLTNGAGFSEPFLWNYLDNPVGIPHPSHTYWMPLPSLIASVGMILTGSNTFLSARLIFIILAAFIPLTSALLAETIGGNSANAMLTGLLAVFPGFYLVYMTNTETFTLYMLLGSIFLWVAAKAPSNSKFFILKSFVLGLVVGLMHLTRAEGLIWLIPAWIVIVYDMLKNGNASFKAINTVKILRIAICAIMILIGYLLIMTPWYCRNLQIYGSLMSPGGSKTLWLTNYDQTFIYPAEHLSPARWMEVGWQFHIGARWNALLTNLKNMLAVQGEIFLFPLMLMGVWYKRKNPLVWLVGFIWLMVLGLMTVIFPYSGPRGGFIHAGAALQPALWAFAVIGLDNFIAFGERIRNWDTRMAKPIFGSGMVALSAFITIILFYARIFGGDISNPIWEQSWNDHIRIGDELGKYGLDAESIVMINNPPGFYVSTGQSAIVIPDGDTDTMVLVAARYNVDYVAIQKDHVAGLTELYENPGDFDGLHYLGDTGLTRLFEFVP